MSLAPLIVVSGPSGSGKSTVIQRVLADCKLPLRMSVSATSRGPRPHEQEGVHYYFWDRPRFEQEIEKDGFLEWAEVFGDYKGTLRSEVDRFRRQGTGVLLDIDVQGWGQVRSRCDDLTSIFIKTSSLATYEQRLRARGTESEEDLQRRLERARDELAKSDQYDFVVINDDLKQAVSEVEQIITKTFARYLAGG